MSQTDASGIEVNYAYDDTGRILRVTDSQDHAIEYQYGEDNGAEAGLLVGLTTPTYQESYQYDKRDRKIAVKRVLAETALITQTLFDSMGNKIADIDAAGKTTQYEYDALNRLTKSIAPDQNSIVYQYDAFDNPLSIEDGTGKVHTFTYDVLNRVVSEKRPAGDTIRYRYDAIGQLTSRTDPNGQARIYSYDAARRLLTETHGLQDGSQNTIQFSYDKNGNLTGYKDKFSEAEYQYDALNRKTTEKVTIFQGEKGTTKTLSYGYRDNGQLASFTYPNNASVMYGYDSAGNLASMKAHEQTANFTHHWQQLRKVTFPNAEKSYAYDAIGRLSGITLKSGNQTLQNDQYAYDLVGNIEKLERVEGTYRYAYDVMDRLTKATPPPDLGLPTEQYTYDAVHNRLTSHEAGLFEYNANHALVRRGSLAAPVTYDYDANGNILNQTHTSPAKTLSYRYDGRDRLTEVNSQPAGTKASYVYDPFGRRIQKTENANTTLYFYNDQGLIGEYTADGTEIVTYGWTPRGLWGTDPVFQQRESQVYWYHTDHLGTPKLLTDKTGKTVWQANSEAFGRTFVTQSLIENNLRFPDQYYDAETDTHYNFMRDYDPATGRYLTSDPIGLEGGINLYAYAQQDPISIFDIDGMKAQMCCKKIPGVAAAHCYIVIDPDEYYGLHGGPLEGRSGCGQVIRNHGFDRDHPSPKECGPWTDNCTVDDCVRKAASGYNNPTNYSYVFGAGNSNTFAHHVAGSCGIKEPPYVPWYPFGKNKKPAKQKKGTTKQGIVDAFGGNGFNQCPSPPPPFPPSYSDPHGSK